MANPTESNGPAELPVNGFSDPPPVSGYRYSLMNSDDGEDAKILDTIDQLRQLQIGIRDLEKKYPLPQIVVCGDQSAGKSSTLQALSGIPFPVGQGSCTKYITVVTLKKNQEECVTATILPVGRTSDEKKDLLQFMHRFPASEADSRLPLVMKEATERIFKGDLAKAKFARDRLCITISGPEQKPLQLLDLPGLIDFSGGGDEVLNMVKDATVEEIKKENSTILAVIRAVDDYSNGGVLNLCRRYDPDGRRTIAAITHPDVGNSRNLYVDLLCNGQIPDELKELKIQWHVLKNDPEGEQHSRDELEQKWFENNAKWKHVPSQFRGAKRLGERLRKVLFSVAKSQLPHIRDNIKSRTRELKMDIDALGCEVFEDKELRARFQAAVERLKYNARDHARGIWNSDILQFPETDPIRLRSRIVGDTEVFRDRLMKFGHTWNCCVLVSPPDPNHDLQSWHQPKLQIDGLTQRTFRSEDEEIDYVAYIIRNTRGQELPGDYRHGVISEVFWNLSRNWKVIAEQYVEEVYDHCCRYFHQAVPLSFAKPAKSSGFGNSKRVAGRYMELLVPRIDNVKIVALEGLSTLEEERKCHPVNFIRRFESERRRYRENARAANARAALNKIPDSTDDDRCHDGSTYAEDIGIHTQEQCIRNTARDYAIAAWIHYDIIRENFLMNVITQVVGRHFTDHIEEIVPEANLELKDLKRLVRAEAHVERQKNKLEQELDILQRSLHVLLTS